jgi:hypothetical protein
VKNVSVFRTSTRTEGHNCQTGQTGECAAEGCATDGQPTRSGDTEPPLWTEQFARPALRGGFPHSSATLLDLSNAPQEHPADPTPSMSNHPGAALCPVREPRTPQWTSAPLSKWDGRDWPASPLTDLPAVYRVLRMRGGFRRLLRMFFFTGYS